MKKKSLNPTIGKYIVSPKQMQADYKMVPFDIWGTIAHVIMLYESQIVDKKNAAEILKALMEIDKEYLNSNFQIDQGKGAQLTLENKILEKAGKTAGYSAHTARSRNDQVMVTELLYLKPKVLEITGLVTNLSKELMELAKNHVKTVISGYTHMQPAKPTTFAHWCLAYTDSLLRSTDYLQFIYKQFDLNPLGAVESYGTSWPIERKITTELLGFDDVWEIPQDAISSRGFFQLSMLSAFNQVAIIVSKMATDLLLYSTFEYGLVELGDDVSERLHPITGSSIMAQKKNPDVLELVRSLAPQITGLYQIVAGILSKLPSGYNRDPREIKEYIDLALDKMELTIIALGKVIVSLKVNQEKALESVNLNYSMTTDLADFLSQKSKNPYRLVYKIIGEIVDKFIKKGKLLGEITPENINLVAKNYSLSFEVSQKELAQVLDPYVALEKRKHIGGTNSSITKFLIGKRTIKLQTVEDWINNEHQALDKAKKQTWEKAQKIISEAKL